MTVRIRGLFDRYSFTDRELATVQILTEGQEQYIQDVLALAAEEKVQLAPDPTLSPDASRNKFVMEHEFLRGQISALEYLLTNSETAKETISASNKE